MKIHILIIYGSQKDCADWSSVMECFFKKLNENSGSITLEKADINKLGSKRPKRERLSPKNNGEREIEAHWKES